MTYDPNDHDVIVDNRGSGLGTIIGVIVIVALLLGIWYFAFGPGQGTVNNGTTEQPNINVDVNAPSLAPVGS